MPWIAIKVVKIENREFLPENIIYEVMWSSKWVGIYSLISLEIFGATTQFRHPLEQGLRIFRDY